ncbi:hypothetical protein [Streptomyces sp. NPDC051569]|uniref:hypothetical protein n=1 Tax=Streptomyces sp. NPDC051569 TaxID=3365661 RepID=UPI00378E80D2
MYAVVAVIKAGSDLRRMPVDTSSLTDAFWAHAQESDGLEHVRVAHAVDGVSVALFMTARDRTEAAATALVLCWRLVVAVPSFAGWYVESCLVHGARR